VAVKVDTLDPVKNQKILKKIIKKKWGLETTKVMVEVILNMITMICTMVGVVQDKCLFQKRQVSVELVTM
jgi:ABC-type methionine transport system ATPase subunit